MSFGEIVVLVILGIIVIGPRQLPTMMRAVGRSVARARRWLFEVRAESGIDEILRAEGLDEDLRQFRALIRGKLDAIATDMDVEIDKVKRASDARQAMRPVDLAPAGDSREYPLVGCDSYGAVSEEVDPYATSEPLPPQQEQGGESTDPGTNAGAS